MSNLFSDLLEELNGEIATESNTTEATPENVETPAEPEVSTNEEDVEDLTSSSDDDTAYSLTTEQEEEVMKAEESLVFIDALNEIMPAMEASTFLKENDTELNLYGLIDADQLCAAVSTEIATESRNIVRLNKQANLAREEARIAIALAKKAGDQLYTKYKKFHDLKMQYRDKIYAKYGTKAKPLARKMLTNSRNKAASMVSAAGKSIVGKLDNRIKQLDKNGRNGSAIPTK